ncbi:MAG: glycine zipper domain-containing protein [Fimbriimonadales bacterium]|nr:glycine zipper domain-containing protein [Fimbriimonadales bacterium]
MKKVALSILAVASLLGGCATSVSPNSYVRSSVMSEMNVELATVEAVRRVKIEAPQNGTGAGAGSALGAVAGSSLGSSPRDAVAGAIAGAVIGGVAGRLADRAANEREGVEIIYRLDNGQVKALIQGLEGSEDIKPGDRIRLIKGQYTVRAVKL